MAALEMIANAKINLSLDVLRRRPDGYHDVKMIMQTVNLYDTVVVEAISGGIEINCDCRWVPTGDENIAYKAARLFIDSYGIKSGVRITIIKRIPVAAGLAGGSTDAAAVIKGLNSLFEVGASEPQLMALGKNIGADVPYCIKGGTALAEGIGEILTGLAQLPKTYVLLVKPRISVSTAWVYTSLELDKIANRPDFDLLLNAITQKDLNVLSGNMVNVLESVTAEKYNIIDEIKSKLIKLGAAGSLMSGSGPTVFGLFNDKQTAQSAFDVIKDSKWECFITETV